MDELKEFQHLLIESIIGESNDPEKGISLNLWDFIVSGMTTRKIILEDFLRGEIDEYSLVFSFSVRNDGQYSNTAGKNANTVFEYRFDTRELYYPDEVEFD